MPERAPWGLMDPKPTMRRGSDVFGNMLIAVIAIITIIAIITVL